MTSNTVVVPISQHSLDKVTILYKVWK